MQRFRQTQLMRCHWFREITLLWQYFIISYISDIVWDPYHWICVKYICYPDVGTKIKGRQKVILVFNFSGVFDPKYANTELEISYQVLNMLMPIRLVATMLNSNWILKYLSQLQVLIMWQFIFIFMCADAFLKLLTCYMVYRSHL